MRLVPIYIDPGTGSMLFVLLLTILSVVRYFIKNIILKLKTAICFTNRDTQKNIIPIAIFAEDKRYWKVFNPVCRELNARGIAFTYFTTSSDDPIFDCDYEHMTATLLSKGNKAYAKLNFLKATILISSTPGLDVYQWKRSCDVQCYIHMLHAASDVTLYRMFGLDYYDVILLSGEYQACDIRSLESIRGLPQKELIQIGIPYMDDILKHVSLKTINDTTTILLAPSWGSNSLFNVYGDKLIQCLIDTGYNIIIRPHPQSLISEKEMLDKLIRKFKESDTLIWNFDEDNQNVLQKSDILISDFSGVIFDFALVYDKPIIYSCKDFNIDAYDAWWLNKLPWTFNILPQIGCEITFENISNIKQVIDNCMFDDKYKVGRDRARQETWSHQRDGAKLAVDYIVKKYNDLTKTTSEIGV